VHGLTSIFEVADAVHAVLSRLSSKSAAVIAIVTMIKTAARSMAMPMSIIWGVARHAAR
jgi:hypothetical protein